MKLQKLSIIFIFNSPLMLSAMDVRQLLYQAGSAIQKEQEEKKAQDKAEHATIELYEALLYRFSPFGGPSTSQKRLAKLIQDGADVNVRTEPDMYTSLMWFVHSDDIEMVRLLLESGADPNMKDYNGRTALMMTKYHCIEVTRLLLQFDADTNIQDNDGWTALMRAMPHADIVQLLLDSGADRTEKNSENQTALDLALKYGYKDIVEILSRPQKLL